jgi:hypothetical protein
VGNIPRLEFLLLWPKQEVFAIGKRSACAIENNFEMEGNVVQVEGVQGKETCPKGIAIVTVKTIPKLDVAILFCQVAGVNEGVTIVLKRPVVLKHVVFTIHSPSGGILDKIV